MPKNYMTMSRQALYDLIWSTPMAQVAQEFGISDLVLARRCDDINVPVPPADHWTHIQAGQTPERLPLPKFRTSSCSSSDTSALAPVISAYLPEAAASASTAVQAAIPTQTSTAPATVPADLTAACAAVKRTAVHLKLSRVNELTWERGEREGPIVSIEVSDPHKFRALSIADALLKAVEAPGFTYAADPEDRDTRRSRWSPPETPRPKPGRLVIDGESFRFRIDERRRRIDHVPTAEEIRRRHRGEYVYSPAWDYESTGELRLHLTSLEGHAFSTRKDGARKRLEDQIPETLNELIERAQKEKRCREERQQADQREQHQRNLAWEQSRRREEQGKLIAELERQAGAWHRARMLRRYLRAARRALGANQTTIVRLFDETINFIDWAERYVDQLDPLHPSPRNADQRPAQEGHYGVRDEVLKEAFYRLSGQSWPDSWKLGNSSGGDELDGA